MEDAGTARLSRNLGSGILIQDIYITQFCLWRIKGHSLGISGQCLPARLQMDNLASVFLMGSCSQEVEGREVPWVQVKTWYSILFLWYSIHRVQVQKIKLTTHLSSYCQHWAPFLFYLLPQSHMNLYTNAPLLLPSSMVTCLMFNFVCRQTSWFVAFLNILSYIMWCFDIHYEMNITVLHF